MGWGGGSVVQAGERLSDHAWWMGYRCLCGGEGVPCVGGRVYSVWR